MTGARRGPDLVFLGPSLSWDEAHAIYPDVITLPPAGMGDILSAVRRYRPHAIALVDGTFMQSMAPFHKEIIDALSQGVWFIGASSMGALRAAECAPYGMIPVGHVAGLYLDGLQDDDEVALSHLDREGGFRPVSEAMVNIRATLAEAEARGLVTAPEAAALVAMQKQRLFTDRHLMASAADARELGMPAERQEALTAFLRRDCVNVKAADARLAVQALAELPDGPFEERCAPPISRVYTATKARDASVVADSGYVATLDQIRRFATLHDRQAARTWAAVRQRAALALLMRGTGVPLTDEDYAQARIHLAAELGVDVDAFESECHALDMTDEDIAAMVDEQALVRRAEKLMLAAGSHQMLNTEYLNHMRRNGTYRSARESAAFERSVGMNTTHRMTRLSLKTAMEAFARISEFDIPADVEEYVDEMAMGSRAELYEQLITALGTAWEVFGFPVDVPVADDDDDHAAGPRHSRGTL